MALETSPKGLRGRSPPRVAVPITANHVNVNGTDSRTPIPGVGKKKAAGPTGGTPSSKPVTRPTNTRMDSGHKLTVAEQYANEHSKRDKENAATKKPIFEWITRKLGKKTDSPGGSGPLDSPSVSPRAPISSTLPNANPSSPRGRFVSLPVTAPAPDGPNTSPTKTSPTKIFPTLSRDDSGRFGRSESVSLRLYPHSIADSERMRIREANNPYPSIPVPPPLRDSTLDSQSMSFLSRSRSPSLRSDASTRPRISFADDSSQRWSGADEDASIRPFPPSHPASPTPSASVISRSASASLLSPVGLVRPSTQYSATDSTNSSEGDRTGRHSRRDSASTKPTTVLSIDSGPHVAHIAQAPATLASPAHQIAGPSTQSSPLRHSVDTPPLDNAPSGQSSPDPVAGPSRGHETPTSPTPGSPMAPTPASLTPPSVTYVQAPKHSHPHPRDNPHPSSPPEPNASTVTLASSTFAIPGPLSPNAPALGPSTIPGPASIRLRDLSSASIPIANPPVGASRNITPLATSPSVTFAPEPSTTPVNDRPPSTVDSGPPSTHALSLYGNAASMSVRTGGWHGGRTGVADGDASVRAVRRKGSWESNESRWSWRGGRPQGGAPGSTTPMGPPAISPLNAMVEGRVDDDSSSRKSRLSKQDEPGTLGAPLEGAMDGSLVTERPRSARESLLTRDSFVTARSVLSGDGREIDGMRGMNLDQVEPVAAR